jgi:hypothetical protein
MSVYVDSLFPTRRSRAWPYNQACHLSADTDDELHEFADRLGLKRSWAQSMEHPRQYFHHYDLTPGKRRQAVKLGAVEVSAVALARHFVATLTDKGET